LGYWKIRGLAQPIRLLLEYCGESFTDKLYNFGSTPETLRSEWLKEKQTLGLDFPNLPYYIDGDVKLTQSVTITKYIAHKHNLCGETDKEKIRVDMCAMECVDFRNGLSRIVYNDDFENLKVAYLKELPAKLKEFDCFLGSHEWFGGGAHLTYVDFMMYETLDVHRLLQKNCLVSFKNLTNFLARIEALPAIKKYMSSDKFMSHPINGKPAKWSNS